MFRPIRSSLDRVQKTIQTRQATHITAQRVVDAYLKEVFGTHASVALASVVYDEAKKQLTIEASSKTMASELLLRSGEIATLLRQEGIALQRLLVR